jgi:hypothetical protein
VAIGKRQLEQITVAAAADAERFYQDRPRQEGPLAGTGDQEQGLPPLAISADGKGVAMLPEARRRRTRAPEQKVRTFEKRAGTGEKRGCKRMAETGCVFDVAVPDGPARTPEQVMRGPEGGTGGKKPPRAVNRWYACDITAGRDVTVGKVFAEAEHRDPGHARTWVALVDGDIYQLGLFQAAAAARGITLVIVIDFIHVLEYLWKAACRHLVQDRMGITGARWGLEGAQAMLWLRAIAASGDTGAYWDYHITREHQRNHTSRYQDNLGLAT